jgi:AcrR family transcriptional regulator
MAIIVEHDKRKHEILEKSLDLFCKEGYDDVTFQKIADACGITRTTLYIYFKNKREIFSFSIKQLTAATEVHFLETINDSTIDNATCLKKVMHDAIDVCSENRQLFIVLLQYLTSLQKSGIDVAKRVRRRTIRMIHLLSTIIIRGQKTGEFVKKPVKDINEIFVSIIEAEIFKTAVLGAKNFEDTKAAVDIAVDGLLNK